MLSHATKDIWLRAVSAANIIWQWVTRWSGPVLLGDFLINTRFQNNDFRRACKSIQLSIQVPNHMRTQTLYVEELSPPRMMVGIATQGHGCGRLGRRWVFGGGSPPTRTWQASRDGWLVPNFWKSASLATWIVPISSFFSYNIVHRWLMHSRLFATSAGQVSKRALFSQKYDELGRDTQWTFSVH